MSLLNELINELTLNEHVSDNVKSSIISKYLSLAKRLKDQEDKKQCFLYIAKIKDSMMQKNTIDSTVPCIQHSGSIHIITKVIDDVRRIMTSFGFVEELSPCIDDIEHNFTALNVSETHPAAGLDDTFYLANHKLLRSHTSNTQIRVLESKKYSGDFSFFTIGRTYRKDDDATHSPVFHQFEVFSMAQNMTINNLKFFLRSFLETFFETKNLILRHRPNSFPFTIPSIEVDILTMHDENGNLIFCTDRMQKGRWLEVLGSGMVAQNILHRYGYFNTNAFAVGPGIERLAMLKYGASNISELYKNKYSFIKNFGIDVQFFGR